jgi:hypothetical protein
MSKSSKKEVKQVIPEEVEYNEDTNDTDVETDNETENEDQPEQTTEDEKKKSKKMNANDLYTDIAEKFRLLESAEEAFVEKEKEFEKEKKEMYIIRRKLLRDISSHMKRFEKAFISEIGKKKKQRKIGNSGKDGFNKLTDVPVRLRNYIGIEDGEQMSRPQVTKLLNQKFLEAGLIKTKKDENGKETKYIILDKVAAKKLKQNEGDEIRNRSIQTFIAQLYKEDKAT